MKIRFERSSSAAEQSRGMRVDYPTARRNVPAWRWNLIVLLLLSPILYFVGRAALDQIWVSAPGVVELKRATLHAGQDGHLEFLVAVGTQVATGATLAVIRPPAQEPVQAAVPAPDRRKELAGAVELLNYRRERLASYRKLVRQGAATQAELGNALNQLQEAESAYRRLRAEMAKEAKSGTHDQLAQPSVASVTAPFSGVVTQAPGTVGDWVTAGTQLVTLVDDRSAQIRTYLDPRHSRYAEPGMAASIRFGDGTSLRARVAQVQPETAPAPAESAGPLEAPADALQLLLEPDEALPWRYRKHKLPLTVRFDFARK